MKRSVKDKNILDDFCIRFCEIIKKHTNYIVVSGFVAISSGRIRGTEDIDMIIPRINKELFFKIHNDLITNNFVCTQTDNPELIYDDYLDENIPIRYVLNDQPLPEMEFKLSKDELDEYQLKTRTKLPLTGLDVWFSSVEVNIAFKEELLRSDKDIEDAKFLRVVYEDIIDEDEINKVKNMIKNYRLSR
ncbi:MAG: hypothetical protein ABIG89_03985 [Candidatus Woesearchaeota archaeon]